MNTLDILKRGHNAMHKAVSGLTAADWHTPGVYGQASVKEIMAQIVSFERVLVEVLGALLDSRPTPSLNLLLAGYDVFLDFTVVPRQARTIDQLWAEYESAHAQTVALLAQIPSDVCCRKGALPWYGTDFALDDFIFYTFFGTKRKWCIQISAFRNQQRAQDALQQVA